MLKTKLKKKPRVIRDQTKTLAVKKIAEDFGIANNSVYAILRGDYTSPISDEVKRAYTKKYSQLQKVLAA